MTATPPDGPTAVPPMPSRLRYWFLGARLAPQWRPWVERDLRSPLWGARQVALSQLLWTLGIATVHAFAPFANNASGGKVLLALPWLLLWPFMWLVNGRKWHEQSLWKHLGIRSQQPVQRLRQPVRGAASWAILVLLVAAGLAVFVGFVVFRS